MSARNALAFDCSDVPMFYQANACNAAGSNDICAGGSSLDCDLGANGESADAHMWAVSDSSAGDVVAWGLAGNGEVFCCDPTVTGENWTCPIDGTTHAARVIDVGGWATS